MDHSHAKWTTYWGPVIWNKAVGTVFLNHLQGLLTQRLGVAWGPERNGLREMVGFSSE